MSAPSTTRASRSRYASPAVGSRGSRNARDGDREKGTAGVKDKKENMLRPGRSASIERSRRFMESWIEPDRAKLTSFQEDGLIRQGVLETMEPLGTRPKPAMIKKLVGIGREASPTSSARGKLTGKRIVLKRKTGANAAVPSSGRMTPGYAPSGPPEPLSGTQSPTPAPSTTIATPQTATSPINTPQPFLVPQNSSPDQDLPATPNRGMVPSLASKDGPGQKMPSLPPAALSTEPFLPDPVKQSIEEPQNLPTTPRSIADTYDTDDECRRELSPQVVEPSMSTRLTGPIYIASELARIIEHKEVVKTAIEKGVSEALRHFQYIDAWALQFMYDDKEEDARFLLLTEAVFTQTATPEALGEWARELHAFKLLAMQGNTAVRHFVPESRTDENYELPQAVPAKYGDLITMDMTKLRDVNNYIEEPEPEGGASRAEAEAEAEQEERVATPPRKRQKTSSCESPTMARKASNFAARASAMKKAGISSEVAKSPLRQRQRLPSEDSDLSSLSSLASLSPSPEPDQWADSVRDSKEKVASINLHRQLSVSSQLNGTNEATPDEAVASAQPIAGGRRRAPARARRSGPNNLAPERAGPVPGPSHGASNFTSKSKAKPNSDLNSRNPSPDYHHSNNEDSSHTVTTQPSKRSRRGMPNFDPQFCLRQDDEGTVRRRMARNTTLRLTQEARMKEDSFVRNDSIGALSPPERPASSHSSLSSLSILEEGGFEDAIPEVAAPIVRVAPSSARATRAAKRNHDDAEDDATPFSLDFPVEAGTIATSSRMGTPRPNKKQRTGGRRLKLSPMKFKIAPSAGVPRAGTRGSPVANGVLVNQEDNDDFCSSCGGNGSLVCCDGCTRAFHELCHDPIVDPNDDSEWFCHDCTIKRDPSKIGVYSGPFGDLLTSLDKKGATSYHLPKKVREYFEGVRTGVDGEYEDYVPPVKGKKKKEEPKPQEEDLYAVVDKENRPIFCHSCSRSAASNRPMMPCSICGLYWHMDCLDPPRPHLPNPRTFVCPCHIDDLLLKIPAQMGPAHKFRRIKGSSEIAYAYRRGNVNNGWIEIEDDGSVEEGSLHFRDPVSYGRIYKLRSSGMKEDFISKFGARRQRVRASRPSQLPPLYYREDAEEIYEAARDLMAFSRQPQKPTLSYVEPADQELDELLADAAKLAARIKAHRERTGGPNRAPVRNSEEADSKQSFVKEEPSADPIALDSALTPVSDMVKDSDVPLLPTAKVTLSGLATPEKTSPADGEMTLN